MAMLIVVTSAAAYIGGSLFFFLRAAWLRGAGRIEAASFYDAIDDLCPLVALGWPLYVLWVPFRFIRDVVARAGRYANQPPINSHPGRVVIEGEKVDYR